MPTLKIGPFKIPVTFVANLIVDGEPCFGAYFDDPKGIKMDRTMKERPDELLAYLLHECLEAINRIYAINLSHDQVEQLSMALTQLLKDGKYLRGLLE